MGLSIKANRAERSGFVAGIVTAVFAIALQPLTSMNLPAAFAADAIPVTPNSHTSIAGGAEAISFADARGYDNLIFSFAYDSNKLDQGADNFVYGLRVASGLNQQLGIVNGEINVGNVPGPGEVGSKTHNISTEAIGADGSQLEFYFTNNGTNNDQIAITNIQLSGSVVPPPDTAAPTTSNLQLSPYINDNSGRLLTVRIDITDPSGVRDDSYVRFQHDGKERTYRFTNVGGDTYEATVDTRDLVPVNRFAEVSTVFRFCDELGNCRSSKPEPYRTIGFDNSGPSSRLLSPLSPNNVVSGDVRLELGFTDDTGVQSARLKLDGPVERWYNVPTVTDTTGEITIDTTALPDGEYSVGIRPVDVFGNPRMGKDKGMIVIDNTAPAQVLGMTISQNADVVGCGGAVNERRITVSWDASSDANLKHYEYQADRDAAAPYEFTTTVTGTSRTGDIRDEDGTYNYRVRAIDQAGNQGAWSDWCSVTLDRTAPLVTIIQPDKDTLLVPGPITVQGTIDDLSVATVTVELNGEMQSAPVQNNGAWQTTFSNVPAGIFNVIATAEDAAGNRSESSMDMTVTNVPPQIVSVPPAPVGDSGAPENQNGEVLGVSTDGSNGNSASGNTLTPFTGLLPGAALFAQTGIGPEGESVGLNSPDSDGDEDVEVLGEDSDQSTEGTPDYIVRDDIVVVEDGCASLLGLCWYWWVVGSVVVVGVLGAIAVRRTGDDA